MSYNYDVIRDFNKNVITLTKMYHLVMKTEKYYIYTISFTILNLQINVSPIIKIYFKYSFISYLKSTNGIYCHVNFKTYNNFNILS